MLKHFYNLIVLKILFNIVIAHQVQVCDYEPCKFGKCIEMPETKSYKCECFLNWAGKDCDEYLINMDTSMPLLKKISTISVVKVLSKKDNCHNCLNGVCNEKNGKCECDDEFYGNHCEIPKNQFNCTKNCDSKGVCVVKHGIEVCECLYDKSHDGRCLSFYKNLFMILFFVFGLMIIVGFLTFFYCELKRGTHKSQPFYEYEENESVSL